MFGIGHWELLIGLGIALLLFGNKLPGTLRALGQSVKEFKKGMDDDAD
jgi:TatA/E family protein of Tat protein translocase